MLWFAIHVCALSSWEDVGFSGYLCSQELIRCLVLPGAVSHSSPLRSIAMHFILCVNTWYKLLYAVLYVRDNCLLPLALFEFTIQVAGCGSLNVDCFTGLKVSFGVCVFVIKVTLLCS